MKLSIIIPTYNEACTRQVQQLLRQLPPDCEIIVGDDGSTDDKIKELNRQIATMPHCRLWEAPQNLGRSGIRNRLVSMAEGDWILSLDAGVEIIDDTFLSKYFKATEERSEDVFIGGVVYPQECKKGYRLRWKYERYYRKKRNAKTDSCISLKTGNCLIRRKILQEIPFDENIRKYGYEDLLVGKKITDKGYTMCNFPTSVLINSWDSDKRFLEKTREALTVLKEKRQEVQNSVELLKVATKLERLHLTPLLRLLHHVLHNLIERQLCSGNPSIMLFQLWKLCCFFTLK